MRANSLAGLRVWITGASSGIGRAVAIQLGERGCRLALSARRRDALEELAATIGQDRAVSMPLDVADRQANLDTAQQIRERFCGLDVAVLNAGIWEFVDATRFDSAVFERTMRSAKCEVRSAPACM